jgi:ribonuclease HII
MPPRRPPPDFALEDALGAGAPPGPVCGIDEVGRGPWAGPVVAGAAILDRARAPVGLDDSKRLAPRRRDALAAALRDSAEVGLGMASVAEIEALGLGPATALAMRRAVEALPRAPAFALVDGPRAPALPCPAAAVVRGDARCPSIAAASIVAKVARDAIMTALAAEFPGYGWERNMGYGVAAHRAGLRRLGVTPHHRRRFAPIHNMLCLDDVKNPLQPHDSQRD